MHFCLIRPRFGQKKKLTPEEGSKVRIIGCFIILLIAWFIFPRMISVNELRVSVLQRKTIFLIGILPDKPEWHQLNHFCPSGRNGIYQQWCFSTFPSLQGGQPCQITFTMRSHQRNKTEFVLFTRTLPVWSPSLTSAGIWWAWTVPRLKARNQSTPVNC